jgi:OOP family OmpA-OmpF porin
MRFARRWISFVTLGAALLARAAGATEFAEQRFNFVPFVGWTGFDHELTRAGGPLLEDTPYFGGRLSVRLFSPLWIDLAGGMTRSKSMGTINETWSHASANVMLMSTAPHLVNPFISVGGGVSTFSPLLNSDKHDGVVEAAVGARVRLTDALGLRLEGRNILLVPAKNYSTAHIGNGVAGIGLVFAFGGRAADTDGDGVPDKRDKCPSTPSVCPVDANGCALDADGDGVCDGLDACGNTPHGAKVDAKGCPLDVDGDGVYDGLDQCPGTAKGCKVDAKGCPIDSDGDSVCDGLDQCPNSTTGCKADARGCTMDADGDGVCDGLDKCPDTPASVKVDVNGCPEDNPQVREVQRRETELLDTGMIRLQNVNFETAKATILISSYAALDVVGQVLSKWPQLRIEIGGHTDPRGSDAYNQALSERRATAVRAYMLGHFHNLDATQISTKGYGESQPMAPNNSPEGMALNRRVEFKVLNKAVLQQLKR